MRTPLLVQPLKMRSIIWIRINILILHKLPVTAVPRSANSGQINETSNSRNCIGCVSRNASSCGYACWPTAVWLAQRHSTQLTFYVCPPTPLLVVVCVLLTVGRCNCRQLCVPHSATERSLSQRRAPGTVCRPRYEILTHCWHSDEWLKLTWFATWTILIGTLYFCNF